MAILTVLASCKKQNIDTSLVNLPVVEAYLIPGQLVTVKLYKQKQLTDTATYGSPITGQQVYISDGSKNVLLTESSSGTYTYNDQSFLVTGKTYTLQFNYLSYAVSAQTVIPSKPTNFALNDTSIYISTSSRTAASPIDTFANLTWSNPGLLNHIIVFKNLTGKNLPLGNFSPTNSSVQINANQTAAYYITENTFHYYAYYKITLYTVNQEYINFLTSNTNSTSSGSTSQTLTNTFTNIVNGYGIFTGMQAADNILYINVHPS
ncbi:MAG: hypothetical protein JWR67_1795 [Mucilaginibacter sp.]|nr:hypothetical protein [Mucilaginibacter sp.]